VRPRTIRRLVWLVFVAGIAGMIAGSIADNNGLAITFGLVTAVTIDLLPLARLYAGALWFPAESADAVLRQWPEWVADLPATVNTSISRLTLPAAAELPASLRGRSVVCVRFAHVGDPAVGAALLTPIRTAATVLLDSVTERSYSALPAVGEHGTNTARRPAGAVPVPDNSNHSGPADVVRWTRRFAPRGVGAG